jgi:hypothetical protein
MRTKCIQKRICEFFTSSATTTYNFSPLKCTHFPVLSARAPNCAVLDPRRSTLCSLSWRLCAFALNPGPKLNKTERFRTKSRGHTVHPCRTKAKNVTLLSLHFQALTKFKASNGDIFVPCNRAPQCRSSKSNKTERFRISFDFARAVPTTYDDTSAGRSILELGTSLGCGDWDLEFRPAFLASSEIRGRQK